ncbi:MAG TPA: murein L,D-transpeptidase [Acidimicrobiales bacterium]|nr:murein L,D-transpeptidase [Acidimicrobiales bacterium]
MSEPQIQRTRSAGRLLAAVAALLLLSGLTAAPLGAAPQSGEETYTVTVTGGGEVYPFGDAPELGSLANVDSTAPVAAITPTPDGEGYWLATEDGGVHAFGSAAGFGDVSDLDLAQPIVAMAATPTGNGYWLAARDGGIFAFGDAEFHGSAGNIDLAQPIVAMAATPSGHGYWMAGADGGVFSYGDAVFHGSTGALRLVSPVTTMVATASGDGYWLFAEDGGVFAFGDAPFRGSMAGNLQGERIVGGSTNAAGTGYWLAADSGSVFAFGAAGWFGRATAGADEPVAAIAARPSGDGYWLVTNPGTTAVGPPVPANSGSGRRIVYSNSGQRVWLIEADGRVFDSYLVSGKAFTPAPGTYSVYSKSPKAWAGHGGITMDNMVRFAKGKRLAIGFHSIPVYSNGKPMQTEEQLGTYRSAGCVRQRVDKAAQLYSWAPLGTTVVVLP